MNQRNVIFAVGAAALLLSISAGIVLSWAARSSHAPNITTAVFAVLAALITAFFSLVGVLLKVSLDHHAEQRLSADAERTAVIQHEAEARLKLETAVRAVQLLGTANGQPAPPIQRAGALFALVSLRQYDLALALAEELLSREELEGPVASRLLNQVLLAGDSNAQIQAAQVLYQAKLFLTPDDFVFPECLPLGSAKLAPQARDTIASAIVKLALARPLAQWSTSQRAWWIAAMLHLWKVEDRSDAKNDRGVFLRELLATVPDMAYVYHPDGNLEVMNARRRVLDLRPVSVNATQSAKELVAWRLAASSEAENAETA